MKKFLFIAIASLALLSSCQRVPSVSSVKPETVEGVPASGKTVEVKVTSDGEWTAFADIEDVIIEPSSGSGDNVPVSIKVPANNTDSTRLVKVTFYSVLGTSSIDVIIHQVSTSISVTPKDTTISALGGEINFTVEAEGEWTASAGSGVTVEPSSGSGNAPVKVTVPVNSGDERDVKVIFRSALNSSVADSVTIRQESMNLSVTSQSDSVAASGGTVGFTVRAVGGWKASAEYGATVTPPSGSGNGAVEVKFPANTTGQERKVKVTFSSTDKSSLFKEVIIRQKSISISVSPLTKSVAASGGTVSFDVTADGTWKASADCGAAVNPSEWLISGGKQADVTVPANTTSKTRNVTVKFWLKDNTSIFQTVTISQEFMTIAVAPQTAEVPASSGTVDVTVTSNGAWETTVGKWTDSNGNKITTTDKVTLSPSSGSSGSGTVTVTLPANATDKERYVKVTFRSKSESSISQTVTIHQKAPSISVIEPTEEVPAGGGKDTLYVTSDGGWTVSADNGAKVSPDKRQDSGNNVPVSIEIPENTTANAKKVTVTFKSALNTSVTKKVTINQKAPSISVKPDEFNDVPAAGDTVDVTVTSDGNWKALRNDSCYSLSKYEGSSGDKVSVTVKKNSTAKGRDVEIKFSLASPSTVSNTVTFHQKAPGISVDPTEIRDVPAKGGKYTVNVTYEHTWKSKDLDWTDPEGGKLPTSDERVGLSPRPSVAITGDKAVEVTVPENSSGKARRAQVKIYSTSNDNLPHQMITIYQKASD